MFHSIPMKVVKDKSILEFVEDKEDIVSIFKESILVNLNMLQKRI